MLATVRNMMECERLGIPAIAIDKLGNCFSATPGDYFYLESEQALIDDDGVPLTLVTIHKHYEIVELPEG